MPHTIYRLGILCKQELHSYVLSQLYILLEIITIGVQCNNLIATSSRKLPYADSKIGHGRVTFRFNRDS